jgi:hypothetical protein
MIYVAELILVLPVSIIMAAWHAHLIDKQRPIRHDLWALLYALLISAAMYWRREEIQNIRQIALFTLACAVGRLPVFNVSLNLFRRLSWTYVSRASTSVVDKVEMRVFGQRVWIAEALMVILFIILQFFIK